MRLFLLRHAKASDTWPDNERKLTPAGEEQICKLCRLLDKGIFDNVAQIWHSNYLRAEETAVIFKDRMKIAAPLVSSKDITPDGSPIETARMIGAISCFGGDLIVVSHNPLIENLCDLLLFGSKAGKTSFRKGSLASLTLAEPPSPEVEYGVWTLDFLISPALFS